MKKIIIISLTLLLSISVFAQNSTAKSHSNLLFGFGRILQWQNYTNNQFIINVYGTSSVTGYINALSAANTVSGRTVLAREVTPTNVGNCNILFIPKNKISVLETTLPKLQGKSVLIVSDARGYLNSGVDVEFDYQHISATDSVISYRFNKASMQNKNIAISPEFIGYSIH